MNVAISPTYPINQHISSHLFPVLKSIRGSSRHALKQLSNQHKKSRSGRHIDPLLHCLTGVGNRGSSAVGRLIKNGKVSGAEMWCLDHDRKVLEGSGTANVVMVRKEEPHMVRHRSCLPSCFGGIHFTTTLAAIFVPKHSWMSCWWHTCNPGGYMFNSCKHVPESN